MAEKDPFAQEQWDKVSANSAKKTHSLQFDLSKMPLDELVALRAAVDDALPVRSLKDLNMAQEMVLQFRALQALQKKVMEDEETPANQIAQCANTVSNAIASLVKMQTEVYTSERMKQVEAILIKCLDTLPIPVQTRFLQEYEKALGE